MKNLCVYCGSSLGRSGAYAEGALAMARAMAERNIGLVYGGASIGVMGAVADEIMRLGGRAIGVIPEALLRKEVAHSNLTELHVTKSMHDRKSLMAELSDGFVALPGGIGTLEEIFEIWTWAQLGFHNKPVGLLNVAGYYDHLLKFIDQMLTEQFLKEKHHRMFIVANAANDLLTRFEAYVPPTVEKWMHKDET